MSTIDTIAPDRDELLFEIEFTLSVLDKLIAMCNQRSNNDINHTAEDIFCGYMNILYGWKLINMNAVAANFPAIDLGDSVNKVSFQVSSTQDKAKFAKTLRKFVLHQLYDSYGKLYFLGLGTKTKHSFKKQKTLSAAISEEGQMEVLNRNGLPIPIAQDLLGSDAADFPAYFATLPLSGGKPKQAKTDNGSAPKSFVQNLPQIEKLIRDYETWPDGHYLNVDDLLSETKKQDVRILRELADYLLPVTEYMKKNMPSRSSEAFEKPTIETLNVFSEHLQKVLDNFAHTYGLSQTPVVAPVSVSPPIPPAKPRTYHRSTDDGVCLLDLYNMMFQEGTDWLVDLARRVGHPSTPARCQDPELDEPPCYEVMEADAFVNAVIPGILRDNFTDAGEDWNRILLGTGSPKTINGVFRELKTDHGVSVRALTGSARSFMNTYADTELLIKRAEAVLEVIHDKELSDFYEVHTLEDDHSHGLCALILYFLLKKSMFSKVRSAVTAVWK